MYALRVRLAVTCLAILVSWLSLFLSQAHGQQFSAPGAEARHPNAEVKPARQTVKRLSLGLTEHTHACDRLHFTGPLSTDDIAPLHKAHVEVVISLLSDDEADAAVQHAVEAAGMKFVSIPVADPRALNDDLLDTMRQLLSDQQHHRCLLQGTPRDRVGAVWLAYRVLDEGVPLHTAIAEARVIGLRDDAYRAPVLRYIRRIQANRIPGNTPPNDGGSSADDDDLSDDGPSVQF